MAWTACYHTAAYSKGNASSTVFSARTMIISLQLKWDWKHFAGRQTPCSFQCMHCQPQTQWCTTTSFSSCMTYHTVGIRSKNICSAVILLPNRGKYTKKVIFPFLFPILYSKKCLLNRLAFVEPMLHQEISFVSQRMRGALAYFNEWVRITLIIVLYSYTPIRTVSTKDIEELSQVCQHFRGSQFHN